jgi:hypothetical protein
VKVDRHPTKQLQLPNLSPMICQRGISVIGSSFVNRMYLFIHPPLARPRLRPHPAPDVPIVSSIAGRPSRPFDGRGINLPRLLPLTSLTPTSRLYPKSARRPDNQSGEECSLISDVRPQSANLTAPFEARRQAKCRRNSHKYIPVPNTK